MASATATRTLQQLDVLVRLVVRAFYETGHVIVADALVREKRYMKDEDLAAKLKLHYKQIRKYLNELKRDRLVRSEVRSEATTQAEGTSQPQYRKTTFEFYYIDYKAFVDVVKWKINGMNKMLDKEVRPSYQCPRCKLGFTDLQMNELINFHTGKAECSRCKTEIESVAPANGGGGALSQAAFNKQLRLIKEKLREIEDLEIPFLDRGPMNITAELTKQLARKSGATSGGGQGNSQAAAGGKRGRDYDFEPTLDVEIVTNEPTDALVTGGGAQPKPMRMEEKAPGKGVVPWMAGAQQAAAAAAEKKQEKAAVEQAQAAAKPQAQEWNQRFFQELSRQEKVSAAAAAAPLAEESNGDGDGGAADGVEEEVEEERVEVGTLSELVSLSEVTQEHIDKMSPSQYEKYASAYKKRIEEYNASVMTT